MQKKVIFVAVAALMSSGAFAQKTSVNIGGKFDACYEFSRGGAGSVTKETQKDGCNSTSRVTIGARENIAPGYDVRVDYDIRFGNVHEGKNGLSSNDKKAMAFSTPFGTLQWGVANLQSNDYKLSEKPYMVSPKDTELVKFGVSQFRETSLTSNNTSYWSPVLKAGPFEGLISATFAFGDNQKAGNNDKEGGANTNAGNVMVLGHEGKLFGGIADYGIDVTQRGATTSEGGATGGAMVFNHYYTNIRPLPGNKNLKFSLQYNTYKGWEGKDGALLTPASAADGKSFKDKNTNLVVSYNFDGKAEVGLGVGHLNGVGSDRYNARSVMLGGSYFVSKSVQVYANLRKDKFSTGTELLGKKIMKYDGTGTGNSGTSTLSNGTTIKVGILKEF